MKRFIVVLLMLLSVPRPKVQIRPDFATDLGY